MRILVLSDIHANLPAFEAVLEDAGPFDRIWCLGDVVGYGPYPNECVSLLNEYEHLCVAGNHDCAALGRLDVDDFNLDARQAALWTQRQLTPATRAYLESRPDRLEQDAFTIVHGSPREPIWEYVLFTSLAGACFEHFHTTYCLFGHTHSPAIYEEKTPAPAARALPVVYDEPLQLDGARWMINPGSVGQPRDGDSRASYMVLDLKRRLLTYRRVAYPVENTQEHMRTQGMPERLVARLSYGW